MDDVRDASGIGATHDAGDIDAVAPRRRWLKWTLLVVVVAVLAAEFSLAGPYVTKALGSLRHVDSGWVVLAIAAQVGSMMAFTRVQRLMLAAGGARVPLWKMASVVWAANAVNATLPAGSALSWQYGYRRLRRWGATVPAAGFTLLASGVLSALTFAVLLVIGAAGASVTTLLISAGVVLLVGGPAVVLWRRRTESVTATGLALGAGRSVVVRSCAMMHRSPERALAGLEKFVADLTAIRPRRRDWFLGLGLAAVNWVADFACMLACMAAVDVPKWTLFLALVAFVAGKTASSVTFLPGGLGVVDAAMIVSLTAGGVPTAGATAGVVLYRLISLVLLVSIGWLAAAAAWAAERRSTRTAARPVVDEGGLATPVGVLPAMAEAVSEAVAPTLAAEGTA